MVFRRDHIDEKSADRERMGAAAANPRITSIVLAVVLAMLALLCWFAPKDGYSESERRYLASTPQLSVDSVASGRFMSQFESYAQDAFPFREAFRRTQALANLAFGRLDGNGVYLAMGPEGEGLYACVLDYRLDLEAFERATDRFRYVYEAYLAQEDARVVVAVIPDKGYYLAESSGHLALDYAALLTQVGESMPYAELIDLSAELGASSYYRTDTHWRQERLVPVANVLLSALSDNEADAVLLEDFEASYLAEPFCGVYCGQSALPLEPDVLVYLENAITREAVAFDHENGREIPLYDTGFAYVSGLDAYEAFLGGSLSLVTIESPLARADRELVVFRDSFGSAIAPLLLGEYAKVTLVDLRYLQPELLGEYVDFSNTDALFLQSALTLNMG